MARRRGPPLHPQVQASDEGAGVTRRRSPRLHPQIYPIAEGSGMTRRRSPRLHPQIHPIAEGSGMTRRIRRRRGTSPAAPESLPFNDDVLREILLRLPSQPSSLPRASAVCKRWRGLVTDPRFLRRFRANHRKPPLPGVFKSFGGMVHVNDISRHYSYVRLHRRFAFRPILDPPDRIPPQRLDLRRSDVAETELLGCRHGRVLLMDPVLLEVIVCDPITGDDHHIEAPPELYDVYGAVLCAATDQGHVHASCHSSPFKVVLMSLCGDEEDNRPIACVYSSETGKWAMSSQQRPDVRLVIVILGSLLVMPFTGRISPRLQIYIISMWLISQMTETT